MKNILCGVYALVCCTLVYGQSQDNMLSPEVLYVTLEPGVRLEVLDWGGKGEPIMFLAGLGNTAHIYEGFADYFIKEYQVFGLTRRGYGTSSQPKYGYDIPTLAQDIRGVLDSLKIEQVVLIGHSIAGDEMTAFAVAYPERVSKLIYLDAAYDRSGFVSLMQKAPYPPQAQPAMSAADSTSSLTVRSYLSNIFGMDFPESEVLATRTFTEEGFLTGSVTSDDIGIKIIVGIEPPDYQGIKCPTLALYAVFNHVYELFPNYNEFNSNNKLMAHQAMEVLKPFVLDQIQFFMNQVERNQVVKFDGADHFLFLTHEREVVRELLQFLSDTE